MRISERDNTVRTQQTAAYLTGTRDLSRLPRIQVRTMLRWRGQGGTDNRLHAEQDFP